MIITVLRKRFIGSGDIIRQGLILLISLPFTGFKSAITISHLLKARFLRDPITQRLIPVGKFWLCFAFHTGKHSSPFAARDYFFDRLYLNRTIFHLLYMHSLRCKFFEVRSRQPYTFRIANSNDICFHAIKLAQCNYIVLTFFALVFVRFYASSSSSSPLKFMFSMLPRISPKLYPPASTPFLLISENSLSPCSRNSISSVACASSAFG